MEGDFDTSRLEKEGRLQRRRIAWVVVALLALAVAFTAGMIAGVKLERGRKEAIAPQAELPPAEEAKPPEEKEVPITFYERLTKPPMPEEKKAARVEETAPSKAYPEVQKETPRPPEPKAPQKVVYSIQVASFRQKANAQALLNRLKDRGLEAKVVPVTVKGVQWFRVVVTGLGEEGLRQVKEVLRRKGFTDLRIKREG